MSSDSASYTPPVALTIAGSDSGGGAGIQADLATFGAHGVFGATAVTALTAQNTRGVDDVFVAPADFVDAQIDAVVGDLDVAAAKTGMLATAAIIEHTAARAAAGDLPNLVVDPVMVASTGDRLLDTEAERRYLDALFPHAAVITPNLREAEALVGRALESVADVHDAARELHDTGARFVVIKGGHLGTGAESVDIVCDGSEIDELRAPRVETSNNHGTGCSFAAAIVARLALGSDVRSAISQAKAYVHSGLVGATGWRLGAGHGPIDHFGWTASR